MRKPEALAIEVCCCRRREFLRACAGELEATQERRCLGRGRIDEPLPLRGREKYRRFGFVVVRKALEAPGRWIADVPQAVRPIEPCNHSPDEPIDRARESSWPEPIAPVEKVVLGRRFKLQCRKRIEVAMAFPIKAERRLELALGLDRSIPAIVTPQVSEIGLQCRKHGTSLDGAHRGSGELREPFLSSSLCLIEFERLSECLIQLLLVSSPEPGEPGVRAASKAEVCPRGETLPVRLATGFQLIPETLT